MLRVNIKAYKEPHKMLQKKSCDFKTFLLFSTRKSGCHAGVTQVTLRLTDENSYVVDWNKLIIRVADPII